MLLPQLQAEMKTALKAGDSRRLSALRMLISAMRYAQIDTPDITAEQEQAVLRSEAKKRREAAEAYSQAGRTEQAEQEKYELSLIESYLPQMMSEEEVRAIVQKLELTGQNFGIAMQTAMKELKGRADGGVVAKIVREMLA